MITTKAFISGVLQSEERFVSHVTWEPFNFWLSNQPEMVEV